MSRKNILILMMASFLFAAEPVLIVNPANSESSVSKSELKRLLKGKMKKWKGNKVIIVNNGDQGVSDPFLDKNLGMSLNEFKKFWIAQQIKGKGSAPMIKSNSASVKMMVSQIPGGIGVVDASVVDATVKTLKIK